MTGASAMATRQLPWEGRDQRAQDDAALMRLRALREQLEHDESRYAAASSSSILYGIWNGPLPMAIVSCQESDFGRFVAVNPGYEELLGRPAEELRAMTFMDVTHEDDVDADVALAEEVRDRKRDSYSFPKRYYRPGGVVVRVLLFVGGSWDLVTGELLFWVVQAWPFEMCPDCTETFLQQGDRPE